LTFFEIQDGGRRHLEFSVYVNFAILRFTHDSRVVAEFGENQPLQSC